MDVLIKITPTDTCKIVITDLTTYKNENLQSVSQDKFKFSETMAIDVIQHNKLGGRVIKNVIYNTHKDSTDTEMSINFDGWFTITHIILPTKEWVESELSKQEGSAIGLYSIVYYTDGNIIYEYTKQATKEIALEDLLKQNLVNTTAFKTTQDYISICFLRKCYINLCQSIFNNRGFSMCRDTNQANLDLIYRRDLLLMSLNIIKFLTEKEQLNEVERLIESLRGCNGLCSESDILFKSNDCGCS